MYNLINHKFEGVIYKRTLIAPDSQNTDDYGKPYIGQTDDMAERNRSWYNPKNTNYGGKKITDAREKYGVDGQSWKEEILERCYADTEEELGALLDEKETEYIIKNDSVDNGFNGSYGKGMQGVKHSEEAKKKISANHRKYQSEETKTKISQASSGHKVSVRTRQKISQGNTGKKRTEAQNQAQSQRKKGIEPKAASQGLIDYIAKNGHGPTKGIKQTDKAKANMKKAQQANGTKTKAIYPEGSTKVFPTMLDAAKECNVGVGSVYNSIKTGGTCRNGFRFERA